MKLPRLLSAFRVASALLLLAPVLRALNPALPPGGNFDLTHWYLGLPDTGSSSIQPSALEAGYTSQYFYTGTDGAMVFWAPVNGGTTSGSTYPRSELRELIAGTDNSTSINWTALGTHILTAQCRVLQVPSTGKVIIGQIHGAPPRSRKSTTAAARSTCAATPSPPVAPRTNTNSAPVRSTPRSTMRSRSSTASSP